MIMMIKPDENEKRQYTVMRGVKTEGGISNPVTICSLDLQFSPATNKFDKIQEFVEDCSILLGDKFDDWFESYLTEYKSSGYDAAIVKEHIPTMISMVDEYIEKKEIDFDDYIDTKKISSNSIFFDAEEIKKLIQVSNYLKLYFIISQDKIMKLPDRFHKEVYNTLIEKISKDVLFKLFKIVSSKTFKHTVTDSYMWEFIRLTKCKSTDTHIHNMFNFILNNILVSCQTDQNPIPYIISVIEVSTKWILQSVYPEVIIYSESINTEDSNLQGKDNLLTYAYNDTICRLIIIAERFIEEEGIDEVEFHELIRKTKENSLFATYFTFPLLSKVLNIPYRHFLTIPCEHSYLLNVLLHFMLPSAFKERYPTASEFLLYVNKNKAIPKTTYKLKNIETHGDTFGTFKGMKCMHFLLDVYSNIVGKQARNEYVSLKTNQDITIPLGKLEVDMITFYNDYFDGRLDEFCKELEVEIDKML